MKKDSLVGWVHKTDCLKFSKGYLFGGCAISFPPKLFFKRKIDAEEQFGQGKSKKVRITIEELCHN